MKFTTNQWYGRGLPEDAVQAEGAVRDDAAPVQTLLGRCPVASLTPLVDAAALAGLLGIDSLQVKDERARMGLGSFKALGAAHAIAKEAVARLGGNIDDLARVKTALAGEVYTSATAGNHGLSIAAGARVFGARAVIFIAETVPEAFADQLRAYGAEVRREGAVYQASLDAAEMAAAKEGWTLLSDTSWPGYTALPLDVMEGYLVMAAEAADQWQGPAPTHAFLQAGVGGLAAAAAAHLRRRYGDGMQIIVVEPEDAPALQASIEAGKPVVTTGGVSSMGRLDCKEPSHLALKLLAESANGFLTLPDAYVEAALADLEASGLASSPSGGAGYAGLKAMADAGLAGLDASSRVLVFLSEGPVDA